MQRRENHIVISMWLKILIHRIFPKGPTDLSAIQWNLFNLAPVELAMCQSIKYSICHQRVSVLNQVLTGHFFHVFHCTIDCQESNLDSAIMTLRHVALTLSSLFQVSLEL